MSEDEIRALAAESFNFNAAPYDAMRAVIGTQRDQANAYNPDFAAMEAEYATRIAGYDAERAAAVSSRLGEVEQLGQRLGAQQGNVMSAALRDMGAQGMVNPDQYINAATQAGADRIGMLGNQTSFMGQLNAMGASNAADALRTSGLVTQGAQGTLANNRGTLLNTLGQREADIGIQQAEQQQATDRAKAEFIANFLTRGR
jgi:hypothetical protein